MKSKGESTLSKANLALSYANSKHEDKFMFPSEIRDHSSKTTQEK